MYILKMEWWPQDICKQDYIAIFDDADLAINDFIAIGQNKKIWEDNNKPDNIYLYRCVSRPGTGNSCWDMDEHAFAKNFELSRHYEWFDCNKE